MTMANGEMHDGEWKQDEFIDTSKDISDSSNSTS